MGLALLEIEKKKAKERQIAQLKQFRSTEVENFPPRSEQGKARDLAASKVGLSGRTLEKAAFVVEKKPEYKEEFLSGQGRRRRGK